MILMENMDVSESIYSVYGDWFFFLIEVSFWNLIAFEQAKQEWSKFPISCPKIFRFI